MRNRYLTWTFALAALIVGGTIAFTYQTDPFGLYRDDSERALSRIDQFYHMRSTKPLQLLRKKPRKVIVGSSRSARLSPVELGLNDIYNASLPGATPTEIREVLAFAHGVQPLEAAYIGWDFEGFLGLTPDHRDGFNSELLTASNPLTRSVHAFVAHKRTLFSLVALKESIDAGKSTTETLRPSYLPDGSWRRNQAENIGPFGFALISRQKIEAFADTAPHTLDTAEVHRTLEYCYAQRIRCQVFVTPVHLFHFEIFEQAGLTSLWQDWHRAVVRINEALAATYSADPISIWGFNAFAPAVSEPIAKPQDISTPWFTDNLHFRPRFGNVMIDAMVNGKAQPGVTALSSDTIERYLQMVEGLRTTYRLDNQRQVKRMKKNLGIVDSRASDQARH